MKNHNKAKEFYQNTVEPEVKKNFMELIQEEIISANSTNTLLQKLMENLGKNFGDKTIEEAIGILETIYESLGLKNVQDLICSLENIRAEWTIINRDDLFDEAFNSMYRTAKQKDNTDLLNYLKSYNTYIKSHAKAKQLYEETDPEKDFLTMVVNKIHDAPGKYTLKGLMSSLGARFAHEETKEAISLLEAINEALDQEKDFIDQHELNLENKNKLLDETNKLSKDMLFDESFDSMYQIALRHYNQDMLNVLKEYYPCTEIIGDTL